MTLSRSGKRSKCLRVRGAPAIGIAAAYGVCIGLRNFNGSLDDLHKRMFGVIEHLASSRPTAVNLFWALDRMKSVAEETGRRIG